MRNRTVSNWNNLFVGCLSNSENAPVLGIIVEFVSLVPTLGNKNQYLLVNTGATCYTSLHLSFFVNLYQFVVFFSSEYV